MEVDLVDVLHVEWSPPGNVVVFLAAGVGLRRMHRWAQRGDDHDPEPIPVDEALQAAIVPPDEAPSSDDRGVAEAAPPVASGALLPATASSSAHGLRRVPRGDDERRKMHALVGAVSHPATQEPDMETETGRVCRFCFVGDDDDDPTSQLAPSPRRCGRSEKDNSYDQLVSPCLCDGTQKWVHVGCLRTWQHTSIASSGSRRARCAVCKAKYRLRRKWTLESYRHDCGRWFAPTAVDRIRSYKKVWWQIAMNSVIAAEGIPRLLTPQQVVVMFAATELRIWGSREARGGNRLLRFLQTVARKVTNAHSAAALCWLFVLGARSFGDVLGGEGGVLDALETRLDQELRVERSFGR
jgi:hypothetical protein